MATMAHVSARVAESGETQTVPAAMRIGEAAQDCGVSTRTLRYWQEIGLLEPSGHHQGGQRLYLPADVARAKRIKELQELLGFSLSEIKAVLETDDVLDELRTAYHTGARPELQLRLIDDAIKANATLLAHLDDTLAQVQAFRDERSQKAERMRARARELLDEADGPAPRCHD